MNIYDLAVSVHCECRRVKVSARVVFSSGGSEQGGVQVTQSVGGIDRLADIGGET